MLTILVRLSRGCRGLCSSGWGKENVVFSLSPFILSGHFFDGWKKLRSVFISGFSFCPSFPTCPCNIAEDVCERVFSFHLPCHWDWDSNLKFDGLVLWKQTNISLILKKWVIENFLKIYWEYKGHSFPPVGSSYQSLHPTIIGGALTYPAFFTDEKIPQQWTKKIYFPGVTWWVHRIIVERILSSKGKETTVEIGRTTIRKNFQRVNTVKC